jgi:hypothetical protein
MGEVIRALQTERPDNKQPDERTEAEVQAWGASLFARARMRWQALPDKIDERLERFASRIAILDSALQEENCRRIFIQVYREIDALDAAVRKAAGPKAPAVATPPSATLPPLEDLGPSLHVIREATLFMEEAYVSEQLERFYNHPIYLGLINYFARWAYAPIFRMWWPILKSLYSRDFTSFMERHFALAGVSSGSSDMQGVVMEISPPSGGFASHCWALDRPGVTRAPSKTPRVALSYNLGMHYQGAPDPYRIEAALVWLHRDGEHAAFHAKDFYVPPGLWGIGIGESFLDALIRRSTWIYREDAPMAGVTHIAVAIDDTLGTRGALRKEGADLTTMYRAAGFVPVAPSQLREAGGRASAAITLADGQNLRWMTRALI